MEFVEFKESVDLVEIFARMNNDQRKNFVETLADKWPMLAQDLSLDLSLSAQAKLDQEDKNSDKENVTFAL
jgi:hypothetical protein